MCLFVVYKFVLNGKQFLAKQKRGIEVNLARQLCGGWEKHSEKLLLLLVLYSFIRKRLRGFLNLGDPITKFNSVLGW